MKKKMVLGLFLKVDRSTIPGKLKNLYRKGLRMSIKNPPLSINMLIKSSIFAVFEPFSCFLAKIAKMGTIFMLNMLIFLLCL